MALPGNENPFKKRLSEKPPTTSPPKSTPIFTRIPLATGIAQTEQKTERNSINGTISENNSNSSLSTNTEKICITEVNSVLVEKNNNSKNLSQEAIEVSVNKDLIKINLPINCKSEDKVETINSKTRDKAETSENQNTPTSVVKVEQLILKQSSPNANTKLETNRRQTGDIKLKTNKGQTRDNDSKLETSALETRDKVPPKVETDLETNRRQTEYKLKTSNLFASLVGLQKIIVIVIYKSCKSSRTFYSEPISIEYLSEVTQSTVSSVKKTIQRLEQKTIIKRVEYKNGRGGWTIYTISEPTFQSILRIESEGKLETNCGQTRDKLRTTLGTEVETEAPSKLVSNINNNLLTKDQIPTEINLNDELFDVVAININGLAKFSISRKQIQDIKNQKLNFTTSSLLS